MFEYLAAQVNVGGRQIVEGIFVVVKIYPHVRRSQLVYTKSGARHIPDLAVEIATVRAEIYDSLILGSLQNELLAIHNVGCRDFVEHPVHIFRRIAEVAGIGNQKIIYSVHKQPPIASLCFQHCDVFPPIPGSLLVHSSPNI